MISTYEQANRAKKTAALAAVLRKAGVTATDARQSDANGWRLAARAANVNPPSATTIALVIQQLEEGGSL
jgi:hypothetical protein